MGRKVLLDGQIKFIDNIMIKPDSPALNYGCGLFETVLFDKGRIFFLKDHLNRMKNSCAELKLPVPDNTFVSEAEITDLIEQNGFTEMTARIKIMYSPLFVEERWNVLVTVSDYSRDVSSVKGTVCLPPRDNAFYRHKTLSYMQNYVSVSGRTDEEMLFINFQNNITEGSRSNILSVKDSTLFYTDPGVSYLSGIIQKHIIADHKKIGFKKCESVKGGFSYDFLHECNCAIMTNSLVISKDYSSICFEKDILKFKPSGISEKIRDFYLK